MLDCNQLRALPDSIGSLVRLERLSVSGNKLQRLPKTIGHLNKLLQLDVSGAVGNRGVSGRGFGSAQPSMRKHGLALQ
jgi:hypothetical protein